MLFLGKNFAGATFKKGENIDQFLLDYCNKTLTEITTPTDCDIRNYFFQNQGQLQSVTFGEGCTTINYGACRYCRSLRNVYIPNSVSYIESDAFEGCSNVHFVIDNSSSNLRGYPWGASDCSIEWLRGDDAPVSGFIFYNDYNTMEQSSQQSNGWHGFIFQPTMTPCVNPESLEMLYQGRYIVGIDIMCNPYARPSTVNTPIFVRFFDRMTRREIARTIEPKIIPTGDFDQFIHFDFDRSIQLDPNGLYQTEFTSNPQYTMDQISPATFNMDVMNPECGCYWQDSNNVTPTDMVAFKLIFE